MSSSEKKGGIPLINSRSNDFWDTVNLCELIDIGFKGSKYTWHNKCFKNRLNLIFERLDRYLSLKVANTYGLINSLQIVRI